MFESSFTALKGVLSRSFVVGGFLPVLVAATINGFFAAIATKGLEGSIAYLSSPLKIPDVATALGFVTILAVPVAFTLLPLLVPFRRLLEGDGWPDIIREDFLKTVRKVAGDASTKAKTANDYVLAYAKQELEKDQWAARIETRLKDPKIEDVSKIDDAVKAVHAFRSAADAFRIASPEKKFPVLSQSLLTGLGSAIKAVSAAVTENAMDNLPPGATQADQKASAKLSKTYEDLLALIQETHEDVRLEAGRRGATMGRLLLAKDPRPTKLGNLRAQFDDYTVAAYEIGFDYLWPRIRVGIETDDADDKFEHVEQAEIQLNFSLMVLLLSTVSSAAWLVYLVSAKQAVLSLAIAAAVLPLLNYAFYLVVVESQKALLEVTKAVIDRDRLDLLSVLRMNPPATYAEEIALWKSLALLSRGQLKRLPLSYAAPKP